MIPMPKEYSQNGYHKIRDNLLPKDTIELLENSGKLLKGERCRIIQISDLYVVVDFMGNLHTVPYGKFRVCK